MKSDRGAKLKKLAHKSFNACGFEVKRYRPSGSGPSAYDLRRARLMEELGITLVLDVGAGQGWYGAGLRECGYCERIISFEPLPTSYEALCRKACQDQAWRTENVALGCEAGECVIHVAGNLASSSFLPMAERHVRAAPQAAYSGECVVSRATLDACAGSLLVSGDRVMLKLDVQGYEKEVLAGAPATLRSVDLLDIELSFCTLYEGQPSFPEMIAYLYEAGFTAVAMADEFVEWQTGRTLQANGLFERRASP